MKMRLPQMRPKGSRARLALTLAAVAALSLSLVSPVLAQQRFSRTYPARKDIHVDVTNWFGRITVTGWDRNEIKVSAELFEPTARILPEMNGNGLMIDVVHDNRGRGDVGDVNFTIQIPIGSTVDLETRRGDISITDLRGQSVHAHVTSEGDISLSEIHSPDVMVESNVGDIFFDGILQSGGSYKFSSMAGNINIRIPDDSAFRLVATAPFTRSIKLGTFGNASMNFIGEGRKVIGSVGDGGCVLTVLNQRGSISFLRRDR